MSGVLPLFDLARQWPSIREEALAAFERIASEGAFSLGAELREFEREYAEYCEVSHCVGVANGTAAIELALRAAGAGPGTDVVTVSHTFVSTAEAIAATGARPVFVDVDPSTRCIDPSAVDGALTDRTAAVVAVHLYGRPAPMDDLRALCEPRRIPLIEDAAQAHGALLGGRRAGSLGTAGCFSFYPTKNLGAMGDGGAVVTSDPQIDARVRSLRHHGSAPDDANRHVEIGRTERLDNLQAALLRLKLRRLNGDNEKRRAIAEEYRHQLNGLELELPPEESAGTHSVFHLFVVQVASRDLVRERLRNEGVLAGTHYPTPVHLQPAWRHLGYGVGDLPVTERLARGALSLPVFPGMERHEVERVAGALRRALTRPP